MYLFTVQILLQYLLKKKYSPNKSMIKERKYIMRVSSLLLLLLFMSALTWAETIGHNAILRDYQDSAAYINFVDTSLVFQTQGKIQAWTVYSTRTGPLFLQVYRLVSGTTYRLIGENAVATTGIGLHNFQIALANQIEFQAGDFVGWRFTDTTSNPGYGGNIYFSRTGTLDPNETGGVRWAYYPDYTGISVGGTLNFTTYDTRTYSIQAHYNVPEPATFVVCFLGMGFLLYLKK